MKVPTKITIATAALALGVAPTVALAQGGPGTHANGNHGKSQSAPGHTKASGSTNGSSSTTPSGNAKAYGRYCQGESKTHVAGQNGTPFSDCVNDMAQLAKSSKTNPHIVCANESKTHVAGQKGTPYSDCVSAAAKLRKHHNSSTGSSSTPASSLSRTSTSA